MNKLLLALLLTAASITTNAATTNDGKDDGSAIGTSDSPQVQQQQNRTDKGATGVNQGGTADDASNLGTSDSPQVQKQKARTDKGASERPSKHKQHHNKVTKEKHENAGTTKGNPVQPSEPEAAPPAVNN